MNHNKQPVTVDRKISHPLLAGLSDIAVRFTGVDFIIIVPHGDSWEQLTPGKPASLSRFCKLIQSTRDGAKQCRMCHILMSIAACGGGSTEQHCHTGVSVLVSPISSADNVCLSVLSNCMFLQGVKQHAWKETAERGKRLGINLAELKNAFNELPELTGEKLELARSIMRLAGEAAMEIRTRLSLEQQVNDARNTRKAPAGIQSAMQQQLRLSMMLSENKLSDCSRRKNTGRKKNGIPAIIKIAAELISSKSNMPFTVTDVAAAARMTPNHFSTLFHKHMGQNFSSFLTDARINAAKKLLHDLSLNIGEIALKAGFDDPGYFTRRFRQKTGKTPGEWRESLSHPSPQMSKRQNLSP